MFVVFQSSLNKESGSKFRNVNFIGIKLWRWEFKIELRFQEKCIQVGDFTTIFWGFLDTQVYELKFYK